MRSHEDALYNGGESDNGANQSQKSREREKEKEKKRARESASRLTLPARSSTIEFLILSSSQFESQSHSDSLADLITLQQKERHHLESLDENTTIAQMKSSSTHSSNICRTTVPVDFKKYPKKLDGSNLVSSSSTSVPVLLCENLTGDTLLRSRNSKCFLLVLDSIVIISETCRS